MKKIAKKEYFCPVCMVIDLPCKTLLMTSIDPYAGKEALDIPLDILQINPDEGTFEAL